MEKWKMGTLFLAGVISVAFVIGFSAQFFTHKKDSPIEDAAEDFIEDQIEKALNLKKDELDGAIDFTPNSNNT